MQSYTFAYFQTALKSFQHCLSYYLNPKCKYHEPQYMLVFQCKTTIFPITLKDFHKKRKFILHLIKLVMRIVIIYQDDISEVMLTNLEKQVNIKEAAFTDKFSVLF